MRFRRRSASVIACAGNEEVGYRSAGPRTTSRVVFPQPSGKRCACHGNRAELNSASLNERNQGAISDEVGPDFGHSNLANQERACCPSTFQGRPGVPDVRHVGRKHFEQDARVNGCCHSDRPPRRATSSTESASSGAVPILPKYPTHSQMPPSDGGSYVTRSAPSFNWNSTFELTTSPRLSRAALGMVTGPLLETVLMSFSDSIFISRKCCT